MRTMKESSEVLYSTDNVTSLSESDLGSLQRMALEQPRRRIRICSHKSPKALVHEMLIYHHAGTYVHPHKHVGKDESLHLIYGEIDCVLFNDKGQVTEVLTMSDYASGKTFYYRIPANTYHTQVFRKNTFFHEVTGGPFDRADTVVARWAPNEKEKVLVGQYLTEMEETIKRQSSR